MTGTTCIGLTGATATEEISFSVYKGEELLVFLGNCSVSLFKELLIVSVEGNVCPAVTYVGEYKSALNKLSLALTLPLKRGFS